MLLFHLPDHYLIGMGVWLGGGIACLIVLLKARRRWKAPRRRMLASALLSSWMLLALLTGIELGFALFYDTTDSFNMTNVSRRWFDIHIKPVQRALPVSTGKDVVYRDDVVFPQRVPEDQEHILFIGDSFTFGHGIADVRKRFSNQVRDGLQDRNPGHFVVSNLASPGENLHWIQLVLEQLFADGHQIDTVLYVVCLNDIETFHERHQTYYEDMGRNDPDFALFRDTYFFNLLYFRAKQFTMPEVRGYYSFLDEYYRGAPWQRMQQKLLEVNELCDEYGALLHVIIFPFLHDRDGSYDFGHAHRSILRFCADSDIPALDLEPVMTLHADEGLTLNPFDAHPNLRAHELAAQEIQKHLSMNAREARPRDR